jgi:hypothetical protein
MEGSGRGLILRHNPGSCLEGMRKATKIFSQNYQYPGQDINPGLPEYESGVLTTRTQLSVIILKPNEEDEGKYQLSYKSIYYQITNKIQ